MPNNGAKNPKEVVSISVSSRTIEVVDEVCEMWDMSKSFLFERAVKSYIGAQLATNPMGWKKVYRSMLDES